MNLSKKIIAVITTVIILICTALPVYASYQEKLNRTKTLITSNDASRYAKLTADGGTIYAEGVFEDDPAVKFYISSSKLSNVSSSFKTTADGGFSASYTASCPDSYSYAVIKLKSGQILSYRVEYSGGWFFGDNGIAEENLTLTENAFIANAETCAYYVSELLDEEKTRQTLGEIRAIAFEVTEGLDDDYQKSKALNYWVAENIYYDKDTYDKGVTAATIALSNVLETRLTVCGGYANLYAALLEAVNIKAVNIKGGVVADGCTYEELLTKTVVHEWVSFWYDKEQRWVFTDPGWDSGNIYENGKLQYEPHGIKYFDMGDIAASLTHRADKAEYREYFSANAFLQNYSTEPEKTENPSENQILITENSETSAVIVSEEESESSVEQEETQDNSALVIVIIIMGAGALAVAAVILLTAFKK